MLDITGDAATRQRNVLEDSLNVSHPAQCIRKALNTDVSDSMRAILFAAVRLVCMYQNTRVSAKEKECR